MDYAAVAARLFRGSVDWVGSLPRMRAALTAGADAAADDDSGVAPAQRVVVGHAAAGDKVDALRLLADFGGLDATVASRSLISAAASGNSLSVIHYLLQHGASASYVNEHGYTALHCAAEPEAASLLLAAGASVHARDRTGDTPLHDAASRGAAPVVAFLLQAGSDIHARNDDGETPLLRALASGDPEERIPRTSSTRPITRLLLEAGADPTEVSRRGLSPVALAVGLLDEVAQEMTEEMQRAVLEARSPHMTRAGARARVISTLNTWDAYTRVWQEFTVEVSRATAWWRRRHMLLAIRGRSRAGEDTWILDVATAVGGCWSDGSGGVDDAGVATISGATAASAGSGAI